MTRYSRVAPCTVRWTISTYLPTPCWECTTKSPGRSCSGSTRLRRLLGIRPRRSFVETPVRLVRSNSVSTASLRPASTNPVASSAQVTRTIPGSGGPAISSTSRTGSDSPASTSTVRWAVPCPAATSVTAQPSASQPFISASARSISPR